MFSGIVERMIILIQLGWFIAEGNIDQYVTLLAYKLIKNNNSYIIVR